LCAALVALGSLAAVLAWSQGKDRNEACPVYVQHQFATPARLIQTPEDVELIEGEGARAKQGEGPVRVSSFVWQQRQSADLPVGDALEQMLASGLGSLLEVYLAPEFRRQLDEDITDTTRALADVGVVYEVEVRRIKRKLVGDPQRTIPISVHPRENDPNYPRLLHARATIERGHGGVWGDSVNGKEVHFIVRWDEWPTLRDVRDAQLSLLEQRRQRVASWIRHKYEQVGPARLLECNSCVTVR
jgi:hypothetical protein